MKLINKVLEELLAIMEFIIVSFPGITRMYLRKRYWSKKLKLRGHANFGRCSEIIGYNSFSIGNRFILSDYSVLNAANSKGVFIGNGVGFGRNCFLRAANHKIDRTDINWQDQGHESAEIDYKGKKYSVVIEDDVWIGANVTILSGSHISRGTVVSAGSVVSNFIKPYSVVVGNPARIMKYRK